MTEGKRNHPGEFPGELKIPCNKLQGIFDRKECARFRGSTPLLKG
jgi:hypothetical protein